VTATRKAPFLFVSSLILILQFVALATHAKSGASLRSRESDPQFHAQACRVVVGQRQCVPAMREIYRNAVDTLVATCHADRQSSGCEKYQAEIPESERPSKMRRCDQESVCEQAMFASEFALRGCGEGIKDFGRNAAENLVKAWEGLKSRDRCDEDLLQKQKMFADYNATVPGVLRRDPLPEMNLKNMTCGEVARHISGFYINQQRMLMNRLTTFEKRRSAQSTSASEIEREPEDLKEFRLWMQQNTEKQKVELQEAIEAIQRSPEAVRAAVEKLGVKLACYNRETVSRITCDFVTLKAASNIAWFGSPFAFRALMNLKRNVGHTKAFKAIEAEFAQKTPARGASAAGSSSATGATTGGASATATTAELVQSTQNLDRAYDLIKNGGSRDEILKLTDQGLLPNDRVELARRLGLTESKDIKDQALREADRARREKAILEAHDVCGRKQAYKLLGDECLRAKAKILDDAGFSAEERRRLIETGITGQSIRGGQMWSVVREGINKQSTQVFGARRILTDDQIEAIFEFKQAGANVKARELAQSRMRSSGMSDDEIRHIVSGGFDAGKPFVASAAPATASSAAKPPTTAGAQPQAVATDRSPTTTAAPTATSPSAAPVNPFFSQMERTYDGPVYRAFDKTLKPNEAKAVVDEQARKVGVKFDIHRGDTERAVFIKERFDEVSGQLSRVQEKLKTATGAEKQKLEATLEVQRRTCRSWANLYRANGYQNDRVISHMEREMSRWCR